jgi:hypothetical protein
MSPAMDMWRAIVNMVMNILICSILRILIRLLVVRRMRTACWILKTTNTHSEYVMLIACPLQQWLFQLAFLLRYR